MVLACVTLDTLGLIALRTVAQIRTHSAPLERLAAIHHATATTTATTMVSATVDDAFVAKDSSATTARSSTAPSTARPMECATTLLASALARMAGRERLVLMLSVPTIVLELVNACCLEALLVFAFARRDTLAMTVVKRFLALITAQAMVNANLAPACVRTDGAELTAVKKSTHGFHASKIAMGTAVARTEFASSATTDGKESSAKRPRL